jgi:hypothetical protein
MALSGFACVARILSTAGRRMYGLATAIAAVCLLSACQDTGYLKNGVGSQLPAADIAQSTALQNQYFTHLCNQVGYTNCSTLPTIDQPMWTLIVRQGMNDIDRRCDAYLEWLDDKKRSRGPWIAQSNAVSATTQAIIQIVSPGSAAISIVGLAFGLLNQSIENYHSRLLLVVESSTINSVVLRARHDFRVAVQNKTFSNRPDAEYALREYLKRCLPFAIETQINDLSTLGSRGISASEDNTIFQSPALGDQLMRDLPESSRGQLRRTERKPTGEGGSAKAMIDIGAQTAIEEQYSPTGVAALQQKLCVSESGTFDKPTRAAISTMEAELKLPTGNGQIDSGTERDILSGEPNGCSGLSSGAGNTFEKFHFRRDGNFSSEQKVKQFQTALYACVGELEAAKAKTFEGKPPQDAFITGRLDDTTRKAIAFTASEMVVDGSAASRSSGVLSAGLTGKIEACQF